MVDILLNLKTLILTTILLLFIILFLMQKYQKLKLVEKTKLNYLFLELNKEKKVSEKLKKNNIKIKKMKIKTQQKLNQLKIESLNISFSLSEIFNIN